jgi:hypothetical protein
VVNLVDQKMAAALAQVSASALISAKISSVPVGLAGEATSRPAVSGVQCWRSSSGVGWKLVSGPTGMPMRSTFVNPHDVAVARVAGVGQQPFAARGRPGRQRPD